VPSFFIAMNVADEIASTYSHGRHASPTDPLASQTIRRLVQTLWKMGNKLQETTVNSSKHREIAAN
jgi:hypothetical protein